MKKRVTVYTKKAGLPPESLVYTGNRKSSPGHIELLLYDKDTCDVVQKDSIRGLARVINKNKINLLIINNLTDITLIEAIGSSFTFRQ